MVLDCHRGPQGFYCNQGNCRGETATYPNFVVLLYRVLCLEKDAVGMPYN